MRTRNLGLTQMQGSDVPNVEVFNRNNEIIDRELSMVSSHDHDGIKGARISAANVLFDKGQTTLESNNLQDAVREVFREADSKIEWVTDAIGRTKSGDNDPDLRVEEIKEEKKVGTEKYIEDSREYNTFEIIDQNIDTASSLDQLANAINNTVIDRCTGGRNHVIEGKEFIGRHGTVLSGELPKITDKLEIKPLPDKSVRVIRGLYNNAVLKGLPQNPANFIKKGCTIAGIKGNYDGNAQKGWGVGDNILRYKLKEEMPPSLPFQSISGLSSMLSILKERIVIPVAPHEPTFYAKYISAKQRQNEIEINQFGEGFAQRRVHRVAVNIGEQYFDKYNNKPIFATYCFRGIDLGLYGIFIGREAGGINSRAVVIRLNPDDGDVKIVYNKLVEFKPSKMISVETTATTSDSGSVVMLGTNPKNGKFCTFAISMSINSVSKKDVVKGYIKENPFYPFLGDKGFRTRLKYTESTNDASIIYSRTNSYVTAYRGKEVPVIADGDELSNSLGFDDTKITAYRVIARKTSSNGNEAVIVKNGSGTVVRTAEFGSFSEIIIDIPRDGTRGFELKSKNTDVQIINMIAVGIGTDLIDDKDKFIRTEPVYFDLNSKNQAVILWAGLIGKGFVDNRREQDTFFSVDYALDLKNIYCSDVSLSKVDSYVVKAINGSKKKREEAILNGKISYNFWECHYENKHLFSTYTLANHRDLEHSNGINAFATATRCLCKIEWNITDRGHDTFRIVKLFDDKQYNRPFRAFHIGTNGRALGLEESLTPQRYTTFACLIGVATAISYNSFSEVTLRTAQQDLEISEDKAINQGTTVIHVVENVTINGKPAKIGTCSEYSTDNSSISNGAIDLEMEHIAANSRSGGIAPFEVIHIIKEARDE